MTEATPAAAAETVVTPAADAAVVTPAAGAAADPIESLIPDDGAPAAVAPVVDPAKAAADAEAAALAADPNSGKAWLLTEGVMGVGEKPEWLKSDKYKSVSEQAKAYTELEKRFGSFVGAPKDGKYEFKAPEGLAVEIDNGHPLMTEFNKWAATNQLSQDGYNAIIGMLSQYEAAQIPDMNVIKAAVGENADARIKAIAQWGKANLDASGFETLRLATSGPQAAAVFKTIESLIGKTTQLRMPKPGDDVTGATGTGKEAILAKMATKNEKGERLFSIDHKYRVAVEKELADYFAGGGT